MNTCYWPMFEVEDGEYRLTYRPHHKIPLIPWLKRQGRFAHLFKPPGRPDIVARLQQLADRNIRRYGLLDGTEGTR